MPVAALTSSVACCGGGDDDVDIGVEASADVDVDIDVAGEADMGGGTRAVMVAGYHRPSSCFCWRGGGTNRPCENGGPFSIQKLVGVR